MRGRAGMAKGVRWLRMVGVDEGMERVGGCVRRVEHCIGGVWGWSVGLAGEDLAARN